MKVTMEMMERYNTPSEWIQFIQEDYPKGVEFLEIISNPKVTSNMLHFAAEYFPCTEEELNKYKEICNIKNSKYFYHSEDLNNCYGVAESKHISDSAYVRESSDINKGRNIYTSREVSNSEEVWNSLNVKNSKNIIYSKEIKNSENILQSDLIFWSRNILNSLLIEDSSYIYQSSKLNDCHFGGFLTNCRHCLFCSNLDGKEFYIFNQKVDLAQFERVKETLQFKLENELSDFICIDDNSHLSSKRYKISHRFDDVFSGLSADFYGWIGMIPQYNEEIFLQLFLNDNNLRKVNS